MNNQPERGRGSAVDGQGLGRLAREDGSTVGTTGSGCCGPSLADLYGT